MTGTILITGANRGNGLHLCRIFAENDWKVIACCRSPQSAGELKRLEVENDLLTIYALDVNDDNAIGRLANGLGQVDIDILLNNAGIYGPREQGLGQIDSNTWLNVFRTNSIAPFRMAEAFLDHVAGSGRKVIATISSMMGSITDNTSGNQYIYRSSKSAVNMVMKSLSIDLKERGITSVMFHPGWVRTDMGGPQATFSPEESAAGLYQVLINLTGEDNGRFFTFEGKELPW
jgi:NAD(P)-dependent dehydrogenase (short-subunit alcohol dehydrogenase family)